VTVEFSARRRREVIDALRRPYQLTLSTGELTDVERNAAGLSVRCVDDIELELP
jgi:hypothetical protein